MLVDITEKGFHDPSTKIKLGAINFGVSLEEDYELDIQKFVNILREEGLVGKKVKTRIKPRIFLNRFPGAMYFIFRNDVDKHFIRTFDKLMSLRELYYQQGLLNSMIYRCPNGTEVTFGDKGLAEIKYPNGFAPETILKEMGVDHRSIEAYSRVVDWNSAFLDVQFETMKDTLDEKGRKNIESLKKEHEEIFKAYILMRGYPKKFEESYGVNLESFFKIGFELMLMCYSNLHTVGIWKLPDILKQIRKKTGYTYKTIKRVVELTGDPKKYPNLIILGDTAITSFRRLNLSRSSLLQNCFNEFYENDLKGKVFEEACRKMLRQNNFNTIPTRIDVFEPMVPLEISYKLWGKQKTRTDIDVIASMNNRVLVIECKEIKFKLPRLREQNQFKRYLVEHYYRVKWISENFTKFKKYMTRSQFRSLSIDSQRAGNFFPFIVTNRLIKMDEFRGVPLVTYTELKKMVSKEWVTTSDGKTGKVEIEISGRVFKLPFFVNMFDQ